MHYRNVRTQPETQAHWDGTHYARNSGMAGRTGVGKVGARPVRWIAARPDRDINTIGMYYPIVTVATAWVLLLAFSVESLAEGDAGVASVLGKEISRLELA